jgi:succinate dehydrogenase / fumarate reductase flavoprotein subunit
VPVKEPVDPESYLLADPRTVQIVTPRVDIPALGERFMARYDRERMELSTRDRAALQVNLVWSPGKGITREPIPPVPAEIADLMTEVSQDGKLVE